jgi:hypothetical protein
LASWGLVFWDSAFSLLICSWFGRSQSWSFWSNVKDSTLKLALKHPAQTTIVQMQKDGTYRVVYGTELDKITGRVKLSVVGYVVWKVPVLEFLVVVGLGFG